MSRRLPKGLRERYLPWYMIFANSLATIAPLSSTAALLTYSMAQALASAPLAMAVGAMVYAPWVFIGYSYSKVIASYGGTYDFALASGGRRAAGAVGLLYLTAYLAYVPAVMSYGFEAVAPLALGPRALPLTAVAILVAAFVAALAVSGTSKPLGFTLVTSALEVGLIVALGLVVIARNGLRPVQLSVPVYRLASGALVAAYAVAGGGASFFLGSEARGGGKDVSSAFMAAYVTASIALSFAAYYEVLAAGGTNSSVASLLAKTQYPGLYVAETYGGQALGVLYVILTVLSILGSSVAALLAAERLATAMWDLNLKLSGAIVSLVALVPFLAGVFIGLGWQVYALTLMISLSALFISHAALSALFVSPRGPGSLRVPAIALAVVSATVMAYGLYSQVLTSGGPYPAFALGASALVAAVGAVSGHRA